jgi:hypothetical protein
MNAAQKANNPVGAGLDANETADTPILGQQPEIAKRETTLIAQFALAGHAVHRMAEGGFLVCRHGYVKHCPDLAALAGFAKQTGVTR